MSSTAEKSHGGEFVDHQQQAAGDQHHADQRRGGPCTIPDRRLRNRRMQRWLNLGRGRHHDPEHQVDEECEPDPEEHAKDEEQPHHNRVYIEVVGKAAGYPADHPVATSGQARRFVCHTIMLPRTRLYAITLSDPRSFARQTLGGSGTGF
jgi:hypothetical protein